MVDIVDWEDAADMALDLTASYVLLNDLLTTTTGYATYASPTANGGLGWDVLRGFTGSLDGQNNIIEGLTINRPTESNIGIFSGSSSSTMVNNLQLKSTSINGKDSVGAIFGELTGGGSIENISVEGTVSSVSSVCGGLVGENGALNSSVKQCFVIGAVSGVGFIGGLIGRNSGVGFQVLDSYALCSVISGGFYAGGLIGYASISGTVSADRCYATGNISASNYDGGLIGGNQGGTTFTNCFWDVNTTTQSASFGQGSNPGGTGKTTAEMYQQATFTGWDFATVWQIDEGVSYPELQWAAEPIPPGPCVETPFNPLDKATNITLSNNDLTAATNAGNISWRYVRDTQGLARAATGRQFEIEVDVIPSDHGIGVGFCNSSFAIDDITTFLGAFGGASIGLISQVQTFVKAIYYNGSIVHTLTNYIAVGDKIGVSLYSDRVEFRLNGVLIHTEFDSMTGVLYPTWGTQGTGLGQSTIHTLDTSIVFDDSGADQWAGPCSPAIESDKIFTCSFVSGFLTSLVR